jgi:hypothetical protein
VANALAYYNDTATNTAVKSSIVQSPKHNMLSLATANVYGQTNLTGRNLGRVFNSRRGRARLCHVIILIRKTAQLKVETSAKTTLSFCVTMCLYLKLSEVKYLDLK